MKEVIKTIKDYLKYFPEDKEANSNLLLYEYCNELGLKPTNKYGYPMIFPYSNIVKVNKQIFICKRYNLTNSSTKYNFNGKDTIIVCSMYDEKSSFVPKEYYDDIKEEWDWFMSKLMEYNPLDYDKRDNEYIYDVKNGKKLINDYEKITKDLNNRINKKISKMELEKKKAELKRLQKEIETDSSYN